MDDVTTKDKGFSSQADAKREIVRHIWGDVHFSKREFVSKRTHADLYDSHPVIPSLVVAADVNGHLVVFEFDNYGRQFGKAKVLR